MKEKILYIFDQVLFSAVNFIVFIVLDYRFNVGDVSQYSIMISATAFLLNLGFALKVESLLGTDNKIISLSDFALLSIFMLMASAVIYLFLWQNYVNGILLAVSMFASSLLWIIRRICVLDSQKVKYSVMVTIVLGGVLSLCGYLLLEYESFLVVFGVANFCAVVFLCFLVVVVDKKSLTESCGELFASPRNLSKSLLLVPLLWFPSNGIYLLLAGLGNQVAIIEVRKLLMLLSPIQQLSAALISFIFSRGADHKLTHLEVFFVPLTLSLVVSPLAALIYNSVLNGSAKSFILWFGFALIAFSMIVISLLQSMLRVLGGQVTVIFSLFIAVTVKVGALYCFYQFGAGYVDVTDSMLAMAAGYCISAVFLYAKFITDEKLRGKLVARI